MDGRQPSVEEVAGSSCPTDESPLSVPGADKTSFTDVVISGISCRLPESDNMAEFRDNLMNGVDMVTENGKRWKPGIYGLPNGNGTLKDLKKFDAEFFGVSPKQADQMDPQIRLLLEVAYEAISDAGQCPETKKGSNTGVFIGADTSESHEAWASDPDTISGYTMTGCSKTFLANRVSYFFNFKGPSAVFDSACSSCGVALHFALQSIRSGQCDAALAGGSSLCLNPLTSLQFKNLGMLSPEARCKTFDAKANGYCRSEGIVMIYLQKSLDARRIYCHLINTGTNHSGYTQQGITYPSREMQCKLLEDTYSEVHVDPRNVSYIEVHGTGTQAGDIEETNMISDFFCQHREDPLLIGCVKSNMGHCETASAMASIAKVIISMEEDVIPQNLHYSTPNPNITGLLRKQLKVVDKNTVFKGGYVGLNNFGFGGTNAHVILKSPNIRNSIVCANKGKKLMCYSARTEDGLKLIHQQAQLLSTNDYFLALLCESLKVPPKVRTCRGFSVLNGSSDTVNTILQDSQETRPVWYVFAGMGCQWHEMGRQMMSLNVFRKSILKCERGLDQCGLKLSRMLMCSNESTYEDIVNAFVAITAIQVALVDLLRSVGVNPDGLIGHSIGELGCAYADDCFTAEETVRVAYWRGVCIKESNLPPGKMAVVGLSWDEACSRCPRDVVPACHNGADSVTISGPKIAVEEFVKELGEENVFAKEVNSAGIAFHSYFMKAAETSLHERFSQIISGCHARSQRWKSTSVKESNWGSHLAKYSSPEYHVNNVLSPVLFYNALQQIPGNAIVIEVAPHGLLQAILKRTLSRDCYKTSLMQRSCNDNVEFCLNALGNLYINGVSVTPQALLTPLTYPVPKGTPMLSPLISWKHDYNWQVPRPEMFGKSITADTGQCYKYVIDTYTDSQYHFLTGHMIDGRMLFPAGGYLLLAWKSFASSKEKSIDELPVTFENVRFQRATIIPESGEVTFTISILPHIGSFEVIEGGSVVASGQLFTEPDCKSPKLQTSNKTEHGLNMSSADVYKELRLRGYEYEDMFKGILQLDLDGQSGKLSWSQNFVTFLDTMMQVILLSQNDQDLRLPTSVKSVHIEPSEFLKQDCQFDVFVKNGRCFSGGVVMTGLKLDHFPLRRDEQQPSVEVCKIFPHDKALLIPGDIFQNTYVRINVQLAINLLDFILNHSSDVNKAKYILDMTNVVNDTDQCFNEDDYQDDKYALVKVLRSALDRRIENESTPDELLKKYSKPIQKAMDKDCVFSSITKFEWLAPCIEVVVENMKGSLTIIELDALNMKDHIVNILNSYVNIEFSYNVVETGNTSDSTKMFQFPNGKPNLIVLDNVLHHQADLQTFLKSIDHALDDGGFLLVREATRNFILQFISEDTKNDVDARDRDNHPHSLFCTVESLQEIFTRTGLVSIYEIHETFLYSMFLLRKKNPKSLKHNRIVDVSSLGCEWLEDVKGIITEARTVGNMWLYADFKYSGILGMVNCMKKEPGGHRIRCVLNNKQAKSLEIEKEVVRLLEKDLVVNILNDEEVGSYRFVPCSEDIVSCNSPAYFYANVATYGNLSSMVWSQTPLKSFKENVKNEMCEVEFASLNFRDVMLATGRLSPDAIPGNMNERDCLLGIEFSGSDSKGKRVMGIVPRKALASHVDAKRDFLWHVPKKMSLSEAASIPVAYSTAYYALLVRGNLRHGEKVLIHSGSGAVGHAAICIALSCSCEVFTTVGSEEKRSYLKATFPKLKPENIFSSRDTSFEDGIIDATSGYGVDIVLNSLSGEKLKASLNVVGLHGRFLELGKFDLFNDTNLGMSTFLKDISFHGIVLDSLFENANQEWKEVSRLIKKGLKSGVVRPLRTTVFDSNGIEEGFRYMAQGKHIGKVMIQVGATLTSNKVTAIPKFVCSSKKTYIIIGGLGGFGLELAQWLTYKGAKSIKLTTRSGVRTAYQARKIKQLKKLGAEVVVCRKDAADMKQAREIVNGCSLPCGGVFNTAMVLNDGLLQNQTVERFRTVLAPKLIATINLDKITRSVCKNSCDWFVVFSSVVSGRGNAGQSNYGFANSGMERICEQRKRDGLHGLAIQWGVIKDVGVVFEKNARTTKEISGSVPQSLRSCFSTLECFLTQSEPVVSSVIQATKELNSNKETSGNESRGLLKAVCHVLGIRDSSNVNKKASLENFGLDSLMTAEIIQTIKRKIDATLKPGDVRQLTLQMIQDMDKRDL